MGAYDDRGKGCSEKCFDKRNFRVRFLLSLFFDELQLIIRYHGACISNVSPGSEHILLY